MNRDEKIRLQKKILSRYELYKLQDSRLKRLLKDPVRTFIFYVLQSVAYIRPFKVTHNTLWGAPMSYYLPEGSMIYYYGFFEANLSNFLIHFLKEGDTVYDIGAHVGYYSLLASELVGDSGSVYSFEPTPRTYQTLTENAKRKNNVHTENVAILNEATTIDFYDYGPKYSVFNTFTKRTSEDLVFKDNATKITVKTVSLDDYTKKNKLKPTFIKIDAEGAEAFILGSMTSILNDVHPVISLEVSTVEEWSDGLAAALNILHSSEYVSYEVSVHGMLHECDPKKPRLYDNLVFIHTSATNSFTHLIKIKT